MVPVRNKLKLLLEQNDVSLISKLASCLGKFHARVEIFQFEFLNSNFVMSCSCVDMNVDHLNQISQMS